MEAKKEPALPYTPYYNNLATDPHLGHMLQVQIQITSGLLQDRVCHLRMQGSIPAQCKFYILRDQDEVKQEICT